jgi:hypothetical protein
MHTAGVQQPQPQEECEPSNDANGVRAALGSSKPSVYKDGGVAIAFLLHFLGMLISGISRLRSAPTTDSSSSNSSNSNTGSSTFMPSNIYSILGICVTMGVFHSAAWLSFIKCCPAALPWVSISLISLVVIFFAAVMMLSSNLLG